MSVTLPETWRHCKLRELLVEEEVRAPELGVEAPEVLSLTKRYGLIPQTERFEKRVATENVDKYKVVRQGWIAYNPYVIWEGAIHALRRSAPGVVSPAYLIWRRLEDDGGFLDYLLRTPELRAIYESLSAGAVNRRRSINKAAFLDIEIPCPPLDE